MSDNPNNLINLSADVDPSAFETYKAQLASLEERIGKLVSSLYHADKGFQESAERGEKFLNGLLQVRDAAQQGTGSIEDLSKQLEQLTAEYKGMDQAAGNAAKTVGKTFEDAHKAALEASRAAAPTTTTGGDVGPGYAVPDTVDALPPGYGGTKTTGGGSSSLFGVAHAASVAGFMGVPAMREVGALIYMEEGLKRVLPLLESFSDKIAAQPGLLSPLINGLSGLGAPMAGLLGVAIPVGAAVAGLVLAMDAYNKQLIEAQKGLQAVLATQDKYYKFIQTATTQSAQEQVGQLTEANDTLNKKRTENLKLMADWINDNSAGTGQIQTQAKNLLDAIAKGDQGEIDSAAQAFMKEWGNTLFQNLPDTLNQAKKLFEDDSKAVADNSAFIGRLTGDLTANRFAANDAAEATRAYVEAQVKRAAQDYADSQLTLEAATQKRDALKASIPAELQAIDDLKAHQATLKQGSTAWLEDQKLIDAHTQSVTDNGREIQQLTAVIKQLTADAGEKRTGISRADRAAEEFNRAAEEFNRANDAAHQAQEVRNQQLEVFRKLQEADAAAKIKEQQALEAEDQKYAEGRAKLLADQAAKLADQDAVEAEREAQMQKDAAEKLAAISQKRNEEHLQDAQELGQKIEQYQAEHDAKMLDLQAQYQDDDAKALKNHKTKLAAAAERLDAQAVYDEMLAWQNRETDTTAKRQKEEADLQAALDKQIAKERKALDDKYAVEAAADARQYETDKAKYAQELVDQQAHYAAQRGRQLANNQADLAEFDREHNIKLNEIRNQAQMDFNQRQMDAYREIQQIADTNARKLGIQVAGDAQIESEFTSWMNRMGNAARAAAATSTAWTPSPGATQEYAHIGTSLSSTPVSAYERTVNTSIYTPQVSTSNYERSTTPDYHVSGGVVHSSFAEGTPNLGPYIRSITTHPNESVNNEATADLIRSRLGGNYSQADLQALIKGKGGVTIYGGVHPAISIGNAGNRSDAEIEALVKRGMTKFFEEIAG